MLNVGSTVILQLQKVDDLHFLVLHPSDVPNVESIMIPIPESIALVVHEKLQLEIMDMNELKMLYEKFKKEHPEL